MENLNTYLIIEDSHNGSMINPLNNEVFKCKSIVDAKNFINDVVKNANLYNYFFELNTYFTIIERNINDQDYKNKIETIKLKNIK